MENQASKRRVSLFVCFNIYLGTHLFGFFTFKCKTQVLSIVAVTYHLWMKS